MIKLKVLSLICLRPQFIQALNVSIEIKKLSEGFKNKLKYLSNISTITAFPTLSKLLNYLHCNKFFTLISFSYYIIEGKCQLPLIILFDSYLFAFYVPGIVLDLGMQQIWKPKSHNIIAYTELTFHWKYLEKEIIQWQI